MKKFLESIGFIVVTCVFAGQLIVDIVFLTSHNLDINWNCTKEKAIGITLPIKRECVKYTKDAKL